jgi:hypothetical protein
VLSSHADVPLTTFGTDGAVSSASTDQIADTPALEGEQNLQGTFDCILVERPFMERPPVACCFKIASFSYVLTKSPTPAQSQQENHCHQVGRQRRRMF